MPVGEILGLITTLLHIVDKVSEQARCARTNKSNCATLSRVVEGVRPCLRKMKDHPEIERFQEPLESLEHELKECLSVVKRVGQMGKFLSAIRAGAVKDDFEQARSNLALSFQGTFVVSNVRTYYLRTCISDFLVLSKEQIEPPAMHPLHQKYNTHNAEAFLRFMMRCRFIHCTEWC